MFRVFVILGCFWALQGDAAHAQFRADNSTSTYYGQTYLIPTPFNPCNSATFNDHGQSISLCIDNFGRPIPSRHEPMAAIPGGAGPSQRSPASSPGSVGPR
jgi:hypothetical protein